jgi:HK97 gp10 family phage protein
MSEFIDISVVGDRELQRKLRRLEVKLQKKIVRNAINRAILPVRDKAKSLVPVDSGLLKRSIKRKTGVKKGIARARIVTGTRIQLGIPVDAKGYYPAAIEYGVPSQGKSANSFMRAAISALRTHVLQKTGDYIDEGIRRAL